MLVARILSLGSNMKIKIKQFFANKFLTVIVLILNCLFSFVVSIGISNLLFINEPTKYSYSLMSNFNNLVTLKISDASKGNSIIWKYDWHAGYDIAYHFAATNTKVTFSSQLNEWDFSIDGVPIENISDFISTPSRVHENKNLYFGEYLSLDLISGTDWKEYGGENNVYISENTFNTFCEKTEKIDPATFVSNNYSINLKKGNSTFEYKIVGIISDSSLKKYSNVYKNVIFGSTKALTYNGFDNHYLDITAFAYDLQGWETEFSYLFSRVGNPTSDSWHYEYSNGKDTIKPLNITFGNKTLLIVLIVVGSLGLCFMFLLSLFSSKINKIDVSFAIFIGCLITFFAFFIGMIASSTIFSMLSIIIDNYSLFFLHLFFTIVSFATVQIIISKKKGQLIVDNSNQYYEVSI